jgi:drug/metabolite transporter (DMT)-like permease
MNSNSSTLAERLNGLSEEELKGMLEKGLSEYTEEALDAARAELERRGKHSEVKAAPAPKPPETPVPGAAARKTKKSRAWGAVLVILGAFFVYDTVLFSAIAIIRSNEGRQTDGQSIFLILFSLALAYICLRAGSRRKRNWEILLGISLIILGGIVFVGFSNLAALGRSNTNINKVMVPTAIILGAAGILVLVVTYIRRFYNK